MKCIHFHTDKTKKEPAQTDREGRETERGGDREGETDTHTHTHTHTHLTLFNPTKREDKRRRKPQNDGTPIQPTTQHSNLGVGGRVWGWEVINLTRCTGALLLLTTSSVTINTVRVCVRVCVTVTTTTTIASPCSCGWGGVNIIESRKPRLQLKVAS